MRVYQYMKSVHALSALRKRRLKISRIHELNDPFEFLGVDLRDKNLRKALTQTKAQISKSSGLLCFSANWRNPILWAHYADSHKGMCLGFDVSDKHLKQVCYVNGRFPKPDELDEPFVDNLLYTKFSHWAYEDEYRAYVKLEESEKGLFYKDFDNDLVLREVLVGERSNVTRAKLQKALGKSLQHIKGKKVRAAFRSFEIVEQRNKAKWK